MTRVPARTNDRETKKAYEAESVSAPTSRQFYCLLHTTSIVQSAPEDLVLTNSNFIDSGASINAVSPEFCRKTKLEDKIVEHGIEMLITLANKQEMSVPKRTVRLHLFIDEFEPYTDDFLRIRKLIGLGDYQAAYSEQHQSEPIKIIKIQEKEEGEAK
ncbi:Hypothetical protein PHPALM_6293 [Phytophthora palmivora]|uniref:Uncharacterized protein n=1 Tax=Phytophthora palmivora TaxID=4796 RepID=A0A2P4YFJ2_9STRA|nr:Hypothetical protein PHPALM_6293 [Phytophthora palmivora]